MHCNLHDFDVRPHGCSVATVNEWGSIIRREQRSIRFFREHLGRVALDLVPIPGGRYLMGSPTMETRRWDREGPQHRVTVSDFWMGMYPVTQAQYEAVMGTNPSYFKGAKRPVECVNWDDAVGFCQRLTQQTGRTYRLPSEAEWEYACRARTTAAFHFGPTLTTALANYYGGSTYRSGPKGTYCDETVEVGQFPANGFGLYDMHGNVWEWCADYWHDNYEGAPTDGSAWVWEADDYSRMLRGGSWLNIPGDCRSAFRLGLASGITFYNVGFRVVCGGLE